jgi:glycosyltransferase involved in cell wall biosynthesis
MKIGFIARGLTKGGVTRYIENILKTFDDYFFTENSLNSLVLFTDRKDFKTAYKNIQVVYIKKSNKIFWDYIKILPHLSKMKLDVVFYPKDIIPFTHIAFNFKKINIIHDLAHFNKTLNEYKFLDTLYIKTFMRLSCIIANKVVADSESTKEDIKKILKISSQKIIVIYAGVEEKFRPEQNMFIIEQILLKFKIQRPFMFYCGSLSPRKNILRTLQAFNEIKNKIPHNIYIAGGQSWHDKNVKEYIKRNLLNRVFLIGSVSDDELVCFYSVADLYLYPSLYEGFGLPILEAQACGCPVLTSNKTSCPEVAGAGAMIVDPYNIDEISAAVERVIMDRKLREDLINKGYENIQRFSWEKCARETLKACEKIFYRVGKI